MDSSNSCGSERQSSYISGSVENKEASSYGSETEEEDTTASPLSKSCENSCLS